MKNDKFKTNTNTPAIKNCKLKIKNSLLGQGYTLIRTRLRWNLAADAGRTRLRRNLVNVYSGYTLIEILVAMSIVGLIFGIGYVSFRDFARRQAVAGGARSIVADLRLAQAQAISGQKPLDIFCDPPNTLNGYNFRVVSQQSYVLEANCSGGNVQTKSVNLPSDLFLSTPTPNPIIFKILGQGTNITSSPATLTVSQFATSHTRSVTVSAAGEIK